MLCTCCESPAPGDGTFPAEDVYPEAATGGAGNAATQGGKGLTLVEAQHPFEQDEGKDSIKSIAKPVAARANTYRLNISRGARPLGMRVDDWPTCLQVVKIGDGPLQEHNVFADEDELVQENHFILDVNGRNEIEAMVGDLRAAPDVRITFARPRRFSLTIGLADGRYGLQLSMHRDASTCLFVAAVAAGRVQEYNATVDAACQVLPGDFIEVVNGVQGSAKDMHAEFGRAASVELTVMRLCEP